MKSIGEKPVNVLVTEVSQTDRARIEHRRPSPTFETLGKQGLKPTVTPITHRPKPSGELLDASANDVNSN